MRRFKLVFWLRKKLILFLLVLIFMKDLNIVRFLFLLKCVICIRLFFVILKRIIVFVWCSLIGMVSIFLYIMVFGILMVRIREELLQGNLQFILYLVMLNLFWLFKVMLGSVNFDLMLLIEIVFVDCMFFGFKGQEGLYIKIM